MPLAELQTPNLAQARHARPGRSRHEIAIIGAGMSGLSLATMLARDGHDVVVLEAIHYPGGCASSYEANGAWFDVGATTVCGTDPGQPLDLLFREIGPFDGLLACTPTVAVQDGSRRLNLTTDRNVWKDQASEYFGADQRSFWREVFTVNDALLNVAGNVPFIPPMRVKELLANLPAVDARLLRNLPVFLQSVRSRMRSHGVESPAFDRYVDAQLLITNQTDRTTAPMLAGALGLAYANGNVSSVKGGMIQLARFLEQTAVNAGVDVRYLHRVQSLTRSGDSWQILTTKGAEIVADTVVTQVPLFNLPAITEGSVHDYFETLVRRVRNSGVRLWSAVTVYALVDNSLPRSMPVNLQLILDRPLASTNSSTLFFSFSHPDDADRAPSGQRTLTISTHVDPSWGSDAARNGTHREAKAAAATEILEAARRLVPELSDPQIDVVDVGTPNAFRKYTGRVDGIVGGIPLASALFPWRYPMPVTPFDGLFCIGDTFFPGQGLPGVVLGALGMRNRIRARKERS